MSKQMIEVGDSVVSRQGNLSGTVIAIGPSMRGPMMFLCESLTNTEVQFFVGTSRTLVIVKSAVDHFREQDIELTSLVEGRSVVRHVSWRKPGTL